MPPRPPSRRKPAAPARPRRRLSSRALEQRWRAQAEITELGLAFRGAMLLGPERSRSYAACVHAGLDWVNQKRMRERGD